jgi:hypothetical protein
MWLNLLVHDHQFDNITKNILKYFFRNLEIIIKLLLNYLKEKTLLPLLATSEKLKKKKKKS